MSRMISESKEKESESPLALTRSSSLSSCVIRTSSFKVSILSVRGVN